MTDTDPARLGDDLLFGCAEIAEFLVLPRRRTYYLLSRNRIPSTKQGDRWVSSRTALRDFFDRKISAP